MKIMTLNMWQGRLEKVLLSHLETLDVDFACMQEAVSCTGDTAGLATTYQKAGKSLGLDQSFFSPITHTKLGAKDLEFGNVIYGRFPFLQSNTVFTRGEYKENFDFDADDYNIRAFQHVEVQVGDKRLHLLNHHGHHINEHKLGDEETLRQVRQIADYLGQLEGAVILCGDFNLSPESNSIGVLNNILRNLSTEDGVQTTRSRLTSKNEVCDYIFVNNEVQVEHFVMDDEIVSDHNALIVDFDIR